MDPTATLRIILEKLQECHRIADKGHPMSQDDADIYWSEREEIVYCLGELRDWIRKGACLPDPEKAIDPVTSYPHVD